MSTIKVSEAEADAIYDTAKEIYDQLRELPNAIHALNSISLVIAQIIYNQGHDNTDRCLEEICDAVRFQLAKAPKGETAQ